MAITAFVMKHAIFLFSFIALSSNDHVMQKCPALFDGANTLVMLYLLQIIVPLGLIAWVAIAPARSITGLGLQASATAIGLVALARVGLWLFPPWWTPHAFGVLLLVAIAYVLARRRPQRVWPQGVASWLFATGFSALALFAGNETRLAFAASYPPSEPTISLSLPLGPGAYFVANGGTSLSVNAHADAWISQLLLTELGAVQVTASISWRSTP